MLSGDATITRRLFTTEAQCVVIREAVKEALIVNAVDFALPQP